jgi:hypothetical protein
MPFQYILLFCSSIVLFDISSIILLGFRYSASSTPIISSVGVAIGAGSTPSISILLGFLLALIALRII